MENNKSLELIKAEIERRKKENMFVDLPMSIGRYYEDRDLLAFIDSLPEEEPLNDQDLIIINKKNWEAQEQFRKNKDFGKPLQQEQPSLPDNLDEAAMEYAYNNWEDNDYHTGASEGLPFDAIGHTEKCFKAGAKWMRSQMPMPEDTVIFMKGVAEGRRLEREDRNDDNLPRYYGD